MLKPLRLVLLCLISVPCWADATLTQTESKWLNAASPVLDYAQAQGLAIDIIVQPQSKPGDVPFAMGVAGGRCKLVLSMRDNPEAESVLAGVSPELTNSVIEAMTAHEVAHCWRYTRGAWHVLPAGFVEATPEADDPELAKLRKEMRETRREEGFADLVGLAWIARAHPEHYEGVHAWLEGVRQDQPVPGAHHDTRVWVRLAKDRAALGAGSPFEQAQSLWKKGLRGN